MAMLLHLSAFPLTSFIIVSRFISSIGFSPRVSPTRPVIKSAMMVSYIQRPSYFQSYPMPQQKASVRRSKTPARSRRNPMACTSCRERKVKCLPVEDQPGRRCERCIREDLACHYLRVAEHMPPPRDQAPLLSQGSFDAGNTGTSSPDGAAQGALGNTYQWSHTLQNDFSYGAAHRQTFDVSGSAHDTLSVGRVDITYGASSVYGQDYQQRFDGTHDERQSVSNSHAVDPWPGQVHEGSHHHQQHNFTPFQYASSSSTDFTGHNSNSITPISSEPSSSPWVHNDDACPYPNYCDACIQSQRRYS